MTGDAGAQGTYYTHLSVTTDADGTALIPDMPVGDYDYQVQAENYKTLTGRLTAAGGSILNKDLALINETRERMSSTEV